MTDQTNPPRTRDEQKIINKVASALQPVWGYDPSEAQLNAYYRAAEKACEICFAELRAGAEPIYQWRRVDGAWEDCTEDDYESATVADTQRRSLYKHTPVAREAELRAGAEPVAFVNLARLRWKLQTGPHACLSLTFCAKPEEDFPVPHHDPLYAEPPVARKAELEVERLREALTTIVKSSWMVRTDICSFQEYAELCLKTANAALATTQKGESHD